MYFFFVFSQYRHSNFLIKFKNYIETITKHSFANANWDSFEYYAVTSKISLNSNTWQFYKFLLEQIGCISSFWTFNY